MKLRYYLRGLGIGMVVAALLMGITREPVKLTDAEIKLQAAKLGMVEANERTLDEVIPHGEKKEDKSVSDNTVSINAVEEVNANTASEVEADDVKQDKEAVSSSSEKKSSSSEKKGSSSSDIKSSSSSVVLPETGTKLDEAEDGQAPKKEDSSSVKTKEDGTSSDKKKSSSSTDKKETSSSDKKASSSSGKEKSSSSDKKSSSSSEVKPTPTPEAEKAADGSVSITVTGGMGSLQVARILEKNGVIIDAEEFDKFLCQNGYDRRITTGKKVIPADASPVEIAGILTVR